MKKIQIIYSDKKRGKEYGRGIQNYRKNTGGVCPAQAAGTRGECRSRGYKRESGIYKTHRRMQRLSFREVYTGKSYTRRSDEANRSGGRSGNSGLLRGIIRRPVLSYHTFHQISRVLYNLRDFFSRFPFTGQNFFCQLI